MTNVQYDLLRGLQASDGESVLALGSRITLTSGMALFELGAEANELYLIAHGQINLTLPMQVRGQQADVLVEERTAGQTVGWSALAPPYQFTLRATAPVETEVIALSRKALEQHLGEHPRIGYMLSLNLASVIGQRLQLFQAMWLREVARMVELRAA